MPIDFGQIGGNAARVLRFRGGLLAWPAWARYALVVPMLPGLLLLGLSMVLIVVSLVALFVLTAPVYTLLHRALSERKSNEAYRSPGSKRVEAVIRDA